MDKKWYLYKIPKLAHFYWGGSTLPYLRYLSIKSFHEWNPDWLIKVYIPQVCTKGHSWSTYEQKYEIISTNDYFPKLHRMDNLEIVRISSAPYGINDYMSEVTKSDLFRWHVLAGVGGLWSDMDIIYFKSVEDSILNVQALAEKDTMVCINIKYGHSIGFFLSSPKNRFFSFVRDNVGGFYDHTVYQSVGSGYLAMIASNLGDVNKHNVNAYNIPMDIVYSYNALDIKDIFTNDKIIKFTPNSIGLHWYAGHPMAADAVNNMDYTNYLDYKNIISKAISLSKRKCIPDTIDQLNHSFYKVLDVGCGTKNILGKIKLQNITTLDAWPKFEPDILHDLNNLPLPMKDNSFDIILLFDVIEHLDKKAGIRLLEELKRVTRKHILVLTPLWWTPNDDYTKDTNSPYYGNVFNIHKCLWESHEFVGFERLFPIGYLEKYFFGIWTKK